MRVTVWNVRGTPQEIRTALRTIEAKGEQAGPPRQVRRARCLAGAGLALTAAAPGQAQESLRKVLAHGPMPVGQQAVLDALYNAGDEGLTLSALAAAVNRPAPQTTRILARMARRINRTPGIDRLHRPGITLFFNITPAAGEWRYQMRRPLRKLLESQASA